MSDLKHADFGNLGGLVNQKSLIPVFLCEANRASSSCSEWQALSAGTEDLELIHEIMLLWQKTLDSWGLRIFLHDLAIDYNHRNIAQHGDIGQWIPVNNNQIGQLTNFQGTQTLPLATGNGCVPG